MPYHPFTSDFFNLQNQYPLYTLYFSYFVAVVDVLKYPQQSNLKGKGFILVCSFKGIQSILVGKARQEAGKSPWQEQDAGMCSQKARHKTESGGEP